MPLGEQGADRVDVSALGGIGEPRIARRRARGGLGGGDRRRDGETVGPPAAKAGDTDSAAIAPRTGARVWSRVGMDS